jgi:diamine N-acetyltransferase
MRPRQLRDAAALAEFPARAFSDTFAADNRPEDIRAHLESSYGLRQQSKELSDADVQPCLHSKAMHCAPTRSCGEPPLLPARPLASPRLTRSSCTAFTSTSPPMAAARQSAQSFGAQHLWLGAWERNARAIAFYRKMGFADVGQVDFYVGPDRQTDRVMVASMAGVCTPSR